MTNVLRWCVRFAEVPEIGMFHAIRKTAVTLVYDKDPAASIKLLGDSDVMMLKNHYVDPAKLHTAEPGDLLPRLRMNGKSRGWRSGPKRNGKHKLTGKEARP